MDRKNFIRNVAGALAAITIGKYLPSVPAQKLAAQYPLTPAQCYQLPTLATKNGWFVPGDIVLKDTAGIFTSNCSQYYVQKQGDKLIAVNLETGKLEIELVENGPIEVETVEASDGMKTSFKANPHFDSVYDGDYCYMKLCSALPELPEPQLEPKFRLVFLGEGGKS